MGVGLLEQPIFLVGAERSGTTLLRLMLDHHPKIAWCNEFEYSVDLVAPDGTFPKLEDYHEWLETHRIFQEANDFEVDPNLDYSQLVDSFLRQRRAACGDTPIVGATVHRHYDRLLQIWPDAKFIKIVRDGRDVARSCIGMTWAGNVWTGIERWIEAENLWADLKQSLPAERYVELKYEDAIVAPEPTLERICRFMGVAYDPAMLTYPEHTTYTAPDAKLISQWRRKLSERDIQLVESRIGDMLVERGYELSGLPIIEVSPSEARRLRRQCFWKRAWMRLKRYGLPLFVMGYISRRLGYKPFDRYVTLQINRKMEAFLQ